VTTSDPTSERSPARRAARPLARLVFLAGAVAIALFLFRAAPRDVTLVYGLGGVDARSLEVDVVRNAETLRHAEFRFGAGAPPAVTHRVRLTDGDYQVRVTIGAGQGARRVERPIHVSESGTIVIPLGS
jgi:hypothetical protein